jgi:hypothetical protein
MTSALQNLLAAETAKPVDPAITAIANRVLENHSGVLAILAYGSTLRDVSADESLIDLYVLTEGLNAISGNAASRLGCALIPPNVYYAECQHSGKTYRAKYAALPRAQFQAKLKVNTSNPYFWARFAQPCRIVWVQDDIARTSIMRSLEAAATTAFANAKALAPSAAARQQWIALFQNTYRTELRPESESRAEQVVTVNAAYYDHISTALQDTNATTANWPLRRFNGKLLSVLRLIKASFTFQGGADYIAWKIKRHSGMDIKVTDWQRRHPVLAGIVLLPKLLGKGAIK